MKFAYSFFAALFCSSAAQAAWVLPVNGLVCTKNLNEWSQCGSCACPESTSYNEKIGQCTSGEPYPIMVSGVIRSKNATEKGVSIDTQFGSFKVIVKTSELKRLERVDGLYFEVEGEFLLLQKEPVIVADRLSWLD